MMRKNKKSDIKTLDISKMTSPTKREFSKRVNFKI